MTHRLDVRRVACPMTWVKTRIALDPLAPGEALEVLLADGEPLDSVPRTAELEGHRVLSREPDADGGWRVVVVTGTPREEELP